MTKFQVASEIFERYPDLSIGVLSLSNIDNSGQHDALNQLLLDAQEKQRQELSGITLSEHPHIAPWRDAYRAFGVKAKKYPSSIENLLKRIIKGETMRSISPLVDLYNVVSLKHLVPVGGEDLDAIQGDLQLRFAGENEAEIYLLGDKEAKAPNAGEVIYADDAGAICRRFNWKEADRTKLTENTQNAVLVVEALPPVGLDKLQLALDELTELVQTFCQATISQSVVTASSSITQLKES